MSYNESDFHKSARIWCSLSLSPLQRIACTCIVLFSTELRPLTEHLVTMVTHHIGDQGMLYIGCKNLLCSLWPLQRVAVHCVFMTACEPISTGIHI